MSIFEFDTSFSDGSGCIEEICKDYDDEYDDDQFKITRSYLCELDEKNLIFNSMLNISNMKKFYVIGYHIVASILGLPNDLDINFSYQLKNLVEIENEKVDRVKSYKDAYIERCKKIGNSPFVYKKSICNVLVRTEIGQNLHPLFRDLYLKDLNYINTIISSCYKMLRKSPWIQKMGISYGVCVKLLYFYIEDVK